MRAIISQFLAFSLARGRFCRSSSALSRCRQIYIHSGTLPGDETTIPFRSRPELICACARAGQGGAIIGQLPLMCSEYHLTSVSHDDDMTVAMTVT